MSTAERETLRKAGRCYICKGEGHGFKDCPKSTTIHSKGANKPSRFPSHGIGIDFEVHKACVEEIQEPLHELNLSAVRFSDLAEYADIDEPLEYLDGDGEGSKECSKRQEPRDPDRLWPFNPEPPSWEWEWYNPHDPYVVAQQGLLNKIGMTVPFPGDSKYPKEDRPKDEMRFWVRRGVDDEYIVVDRWQNHRVVRIAGSFLRRPNYNILRWYAVSCCVHHGLLLPEARTYKEVPLVQDHLVEAAEYHLTKCAPYVGDGEYTPAELDKRFWLCKDDADQNTYHVWDGHRRLQTRILKAYLVNPCFNFPRWYNTVLYRREREFVQRLENVEDNWNLASLFSLDPEYQAAADAADENSVDGSCKLGEIGINMLEILELNGQQVQRRTYPSLQRNAATAKDASRAVPKPVIVTVKINGHPVRTLIDSESMGDFISTSIVDQLKLKTVELKTPLTLTLAVQGSQSKINSGCKAKFSYQDIDEA
ncbi:hypothetical protein BDN71DRAFT_1510592 [Pleurotus eryngii]|uniref:CCHC-type domain-containing protein n=1 Tax=Pleurotus eryngii TaxID=5323 RepID=A0A9P6D3J8_PLEER|nr:hypothetical protein BDN71DRAFT_1510592 [Pleurotus eryngii]